VEDAAPVLVTPEPPAGIFDAKCDEKGRLKLPVRFATYFKSNDVGRVFITTLDLRICRIYPEKVWQSNQNFFNQPGEDVDAAEDLSFIANHYGDFSTMDEHGRVLIPTDLRRTLELEKQTVWLDYFRGHINVYPRKIHDERMQRAVVGLADKAKGMDRKGFQ
jgi:DNA-binding transcriptional regulator/RsmH inhibitor MraZ